MENGLRHMHNSFKRRRNGDVFRVLISFVKKQTFARNITKGKKTSFLLGRSFFDGEK